MGCLTLTLQREARSCARVILRGAISGTTGFADSVRSVVISENEPVVLPSFPVVTNVFEGAYGMPAKGRLSTFASRMALKRSLQAEAWTPELNRFAAHLSPGGWAGFVSA